MINQDLKEEPKWVQDELQTEKYQQQNQQQQEQGIQKYDPHSSLDLLERKEKKKTTEFFVQKPTIQNNKRIKLQARFEVNNSDECQEEALSKGIQSWEKRRNSSFDSNYQVEEQDGLTQRVKDTSCPSSPPAFSMEQRFSYGNNINTNNSNMMAGGASLKQQRKLKLEKNISLFNLLKAELQKATERKGARKKTIRRNLKEMQVQSNIQQPNPMKVSGYGMKMSQSNQSPQIPFKRKERRNSTLTNASAKSLCQVQQNQQRFSLFRGQHRRNATIAPNTIGPILRNAGSFIGGQHSGTETPKLPPSSQQQYQQTQQLLQAQNSLLSLQQIQFLKELEVVLEKNQMKEEDYIADWQWYVNFDKLCNYRWYFPWNNFQHIFASFKRFQKKIIKLSACAHAFADTRLKRKSRSQYTYSKLP